MNADILAHASRLLSSLSLAGAYGYEDTSRADVRLGVAQPRKGVTVHVATYPLGAAQELCSRDLAQWLGTNAAPRRLELTDAGRARRARENAPLGLEPFLAQHKPFVRQPADTGPDAPDVFHDQDESPLVWLATRKGRDGRPLIDTAMFQAGEKLRRDMTAAQILPRVTANWTATVASRGRGAGNEMSSEVALAARQRVTKALDAVGPDFAGLLIDVCGFAKGLAIVESERGWPLRSSKVVLVMALKQLARHFGFSNTAVGPTGGKRPRHWGAEDFRPVIGGK